MIASDPACAIALGEAPAPTGDRRLLVVFASRVAAELAHFAAHVGYEVVLLDPDPQRVVSGLRGVASAADAGIDRHADVVVTDHDRPELGDVLRDVLRLEPRWIGVMGSPRHPAPHVPALRERGVAEEDISRVHRPIGLDIGSRAPGEIAISTIAGLLASRAGRPGGFYAATADSSLH